jgi:hypothetical protein
MSGKEIQEKAMEAAWSLPTTATFPIFLPSLSGESPSFLLLQLKVRCNHAHVIRMCENSIIK